MAYEYNQRDVLDFANAMGGEKFEKGEELFFKYCPYCKGGGHDDKTFSINLTNGTYKCFRASCDKQGHFVQLARDFNYKLDDGYEPKKYKKLPQIEVKTKPNAVRYMESRGISQAVTERYQITTQTNNDNILVFPFYDENGILVSVKYRNTKFIKGKGSKEWFETDTKPILFGMKQCEGFERLVITEGQIDSLSLAECGIKNAVSVPTGATGFTWLSNVWDWIIKFSEVIVFGDMENGKMTMLDELSLRLPMRVKAVQEQYYLHEKDANEILIKYGKDAIAEAIDNAIVPPMKNIKRLADVKAVDLNKLPKIKTNIREVDRLTGGLIFGQVIILTGKRGNGKSTFMSQLICEAFEQNCPTMIYSGELSDYHFKRWVDLQIAGPKNVIENINEYGDFVYNIPNDKISAINDWYRDLAFIYDNNYIPNENEELEKLTDTIISAIKQYGVKLICVDNLMTAMDVGMDVDLYRQQSLFVSTLKTIAVRYDVCVVLVAHPRKSKDEFTNDDVAGSGDITNRVDVVMSYERDEKDSDKGRLLITKNRLTGKLALKGNAIELLYSGSTKRIVSMSGNSRKQYAWEREESPINNIDALPFD